jgi:hypothetical protein
MLTELRKDYRELREAARREFDGSVQMERMKFNDRLVALRREYERCLAGIPPNAAARPMKRYKRA